LVADPGEGADDAEEDDERDQLEDGAHDEGCYRAEAREQGVVRGLEDSRTRATRRIDERKADMRSDDGMTAGRAEWAE
jgi:hypothetical protein